MSRRAVTILSLVVALVVVGAPTVAAARHRHHHQQHRPPEQGDTTQAAPDGRISPNPRAASMRKSDDALRKALTSDPVAKAAEIPGALRDPKTRALVTASFAAATLPRPDLAGFRHRDGGYGWVGPVFWPFATYDIFDAALWGDGVDATVWGYGAADLITGLFGIYPDDDLTAFARYLPASSGSAPQTFVLTRMCGEVSGEIAGIPVETVRSSLQIDDSQREALDDLSGALSTASQRIAESCPETLPLSARQRLDAMSQRLGAMVAAIDTVQPRLDAFFATLNDTQKAQFVALGAPSIPSQPARANSTSANDANAAPTAAAQACAAAQVPATSALMWPKAALERAVGKGDAENKTLGGLQAAVAKVANQFASTCQPADAMTPPARLAAIKARLAAMSSALDTLTAAVDPVYAALDPVQTVDFDAVGSEPARDMAMAAAAQRFRMPQPHANTRSWEARAAEVGGADAKVDETKAAEAKSATANAKPADTPQADAQVDKAKQAEAAPVHHHGGGRRHLARYSHRVPGPVRAVGRVLGALLP